MNVVMPRHQVAQLVAAPELDVAAVYLVQVVEVVSLKHLVGELRQAHPVCALEPGLHAVAAEHGPHPEEPTGLGQEVHDVPALVPGQVVHHSHGAQVPGAVVEVQFVVGENPLDALPDAARVRLHGVRGQRLPLARLAARVAYLRGGASEDSEDVMPGTSEMQQADEGEQVAHVEAVGRGVKAAVDGLGTGLEQTRQLILRGPFWERVLQKAPFIQREEQPGARSRRTVTTRSERGAVSQPPRQNIGSTPR